VEVEWPDGEIYDGVLLGVTSQSSYHVCYEMSGQESANDATVVSVSHSSHTRLPTQIQFDDGYESTVKRRFIKILKDEFCPPSPKKAHREAEAAGAAGDVETASDGRRRRLKPKQFIDMVM
jgi:hypothetical protein